MCEFCKKFDFGDARTEVDKWGARIYLALGNTKFPIELQFNYCPECGEKLKGENTNEQ